MIKHIAIAATALLTPLRCDPPAPSPGVGPGFSTEGGYCTQYEPLLAQYAPYAGWDVHHMASIMWHESLCYPDALNKGGNDAGLLQVTPTNYAFLRRALGEPVTRAKLFDPVFNIRAAAALYDFWFRAKGDGLIPWRATRGYHS